MKTKEERQEIRERLENSRTALAEITGGAGRSAMAADMIALLDDLDEWNQSFEQCLRAIRGCARFNEAAQAYEVNIAIEYWDQLFDRGGWSQHERCSSTCDRVTK